MFKIVFVVVASWALVVCLLVYTPLSRGWNSILIGYLVAWFIIPVVLVTLSRVTTVRRNRLLIRTFYNDSYYEGACQSCNGGIQFYDNYLEDWGPVSRRLFNTPSDDMGRFTPTVRIRLCGRCGATGYVTEGAGAVDTGLKEIK